MPASPMMFPFVSDFPYFGPDQRGATGESQYILKLRSLQKVFAPWKKDDCRDKRKLRINLRKELRESVCLLIGASSFSSFNRSGSTCLCLLNVHFHALRQVRGTLNSCIRHEISLSDCHH
ncbi:MAG: hypothetical protein ABI642_00515 [Polaromonas sp.]